MIIYQDDFNAAAQRLAMRALLNFERRKYSETFSSKECSELLRRAFGPMMLVKLIRRLSARGHKLVMEKNPEPRATMLRHRAKFSAGLLHTIKQASARLSDAAI